MLVLRKFDFGNDENALDISGTFWCRQLIVVI